ncbi:MAG: S9 family peptidase [Thermonemataceae bacterium]|nr:S9 family peptidase [Thermonemataceae bacterium]
MKKKQHFLYISLLLLWATSQSIAQKKAVSLEEIWQNYSFYPKAADGFNYMKDSKFFTVSEGNSVYKYETKSNKKLALIAELPISFQSYELNAQEDKLLLMTQREPIYRRSFKAEYYVYDLKTKKNTQISKNGKQSYATLSPDGSKVAFARDNNLFLVDLATMTETAITTNGKFNELINGSCDWVYEEEFGFAQAFFWSPDSKKIAFYTFDESQVKEYNMQMWKGLYPQDYRFKYPKAGEKNSVVGLSVYHLDKQQSQKLDLGTENDIYIARVKWTQNPNLLSIRKLNRLQNKLEIIHADLAKNTTQSVYTEENKAYVDVEFTDDLHYLKNGKEFIFASEKSGYKHLYLFDMNGKELRAITKGDWEVSKVQGIDEKKGLIYFTSTKDSPLERYLYVANLKKEAIKQVLSTKGYHEITMSDDCQFFMDELSTANTPPVYSLYEISGKKIKDLENNKDLSEKLSKYEISSKEFFTIQTTEATLNAWQIKPQNFDPNQKYPVLMFVYGGPGSQEVENKWDYANYFWYQHLASKGYLIVCVDNRGTGGRGEAFRKITYGQLGKLEVQDQIAAAKYLAKQSYVDATKIGIWGWSYGGYMASNCIMQGNDVFSYAIAVAPVSNWRFYDTIYTERYLGLPQNNAQGYDANSPISHVNKLQGKYLLVHGTGDDNVHFQNAVELQNALIRAGKQFESFYYPNRNHGIYGGNTRLHLYEMMTNFLKRNVK